MGCIESEGGCCCGAPAAFGFLNELGVEPRAQHRELGERISHRNRDVIWVSGKIGRFQDCRGCWIPREAVGKIGG
jgi:hypothetical protein